MTYTYDVGENMSAEARKPHQAQEHPPLLPDFEHFLADHDFVVPDNEETVRRDYELREQFAVAVSRFTREQVVTLNADRAALRRDQHLLLPQDLVERSISQGITIARDLPARKHDLFEKYARPAIKLRLAYPQIAGAIVLGMEMKYSKHELTVCATDTLIGYGKTLAQLPVRHVGYHP
jgi:hypothetical protein